jgi:arsenate reductase
MTRKAQLDAEFAELLGLDRALEGVSEDLARRFHGVYSRETVHRCVHESYDQLAATATVQIHLPVLAGRIARDRLTATAKNEGLIVTTTPAVLFVCVHNAGRSQMAAALLNHHAKGQVEVRSAGSAPADRINPAVLEVMREIGLDLSQEFPQPLTDEAVQVSDVVVTMGCGDACPVYPGKRYLDWDLPDPAGKNVDEVRTIRDDIDDRVRNLIAQLVTA